MIVRKISFIIFLLAIAGITLVINKTPQTKTVQKDFITAQQFLNDSFKLAKNVFDSGFQPTFLIALWRGGAPVGVAITEYFMYKNQAIKNHQSVRVSAYNHDQLKPTAQVFNLDYVVRTLTKDDRLLLVDDVVDTGTSILTLIEEIKKLCGENTPKEIRVASVYHKPATAAVKPDFFVHQTDSWLVFPHELQGLTLEEIAQMKGINL